MSEITICKATVGDLDAIKDLADEHKHELGFVLRPALARSIERTEVFVAKSNGSVAGFLEYHHRQDSQTTLYHIVVRPDCRCQGIGQQLVDALVQDARERDKEVVHLKCPVDLEANEFYQQLGFSRARVQRSRNRDLAIWRLQCRPAESFRMRDRNEL